MDGQECQCCYEEREASEMVKCNGVGLHIFCIPCARRQVELDATNGRAETHCILTRACEGMFSHATRDRVLTEVDKRYVEREEFEREIYAAGLEGFWRCPFCDFGAVCEEVEGETTFWCRNEPCQRTSCRLCQREAHGGALCSGTGTGAAKGVWLGQARVRCPGCGRQLCREAGPNAGYNLKYCSCRTYMPVCLICGGDLKAEGTLHFGYFHKEQIPAGVQGCAMYEWPNREWNPRWGPSPW